MKTKKLLLVPLFVFLLFSCNEQHESKAYTVLNPLERDDYYEKCRKLVLSENKTAKVYNFKIEGKEIDELEVQYLGSIITSENDTLKIINSVNYTGLYADSRKANAKLFLYKKNNKIGSYHLGNLHSLPSAIKDNNLVFKYNDEQCNQTTIISLQDSIPKQIFVTCTNKEGDLHTFER